MAIPSPSFELADEAATLGLGGEISRVLQPGMTIFLHGDLGAGKTTLTRGVLRALGFEGRVKSPTYALVELYVISKLNLYHFDFYRFRDSEEWHEAGFRDLFNGENVCLVEWPEKAQGLLPLPDLAIALSATPQDARLATITSHTPTGQTALRTLLTSRK
jgi:tRNA threonylcarbamoyladenosine biosynthesis protein TsaE